jgi:hypothetical protein
VLHLLLALSPLLLHGPLRQQQRLALAALLLLLTDAS